MSDWLDSGGISKVNVGHEMQVVWQIETFHTKKSGYGEALSNPKQGGASGACRWG